MILIILLQVKVNVKYLKQGRYSFGVCVLPRKNEKGEWVNTGVRLDGYDYTSKNIITLGMYEEKKIYGFKFIQTMSDSVALKKGWMGTVISNSKDIFLEDSITCLKGIGPAMGAKFLKGNIRKIKELIACKGAQFLSLSEATGITVQRLTNIQTTANETVVEGSRCQQQFDHRIASNPFLSRYGPDKWEDKFVKDKISNMTNKVCVTELITHINNTTAAAYKGTPYEKTYLWSHDALSQLIDGRCQEWMKEQNFYKNWLKPELGISDEVVWTCDGNRTISTRYKARPVGDSPEMMPLDNSLFRDLRSSLDLHVAITAHLPESDPKKFSKTTPKRITKAIMRLWNPEKGVSPTPSRILQDIDRFTVACKKIVEHGGGEVKGLAERNGHRRGKVGTEFDRRRRPDAERKKKPHQKKTLADLNLLPEAETVLKNILEFELKNHDV